MARRLTSFNGTKAGDVITVKEKSSHLLSSRELTKDMVITTPQWISIDLDKLEGKTLAAPSQKTLIYQSQSTASLSSTKIVARLINTFAYDAPIINRQISIDLWENK